MSYFSTGKSLEKLRIIYFLKKLGIGITFEQLSDVALENDWMPYFELRSMIYELEEDGYICAVPRAFGQAYCVTDKGNESLDMFIHTIPASIREQCDNYIEKNKKSLLRETQLTSFVEKISSEKYIVTLKAMEEDITLIEIKLCFGTNDLANKAAKRWTDKSSSIYRSITNELLDD